MPLELEMFPLVPIGDRIHFYDGFDRPRGAERRAHHAIDIGTVRGTLVVCSVHGRVIHEWVSKKERRTVIGCGWSDAGGNIVLVLDNNGFVHYFAHMNLAPAVRSGERVRPGKLIGQVGNAGSIAAGSNPHLHYQVWRVGRDRDDESAALRFTRPFGPSVNPYSELARTARLLGGRVASNSGVWIQ